MPVLILFFCVVLILIFILGHTVIESNKKNSIRSPHFGGFIPTGPPITKEDKKRLNRKYITNNPISLKQDLERAELMRNEEHDRYERTYRELQKLRKQYDDLHDRYRSLEKTYQMEKRRADKAQQKVRQLERKW